MSLHILNAIAITGLYAILSAFISNPTEAHDTFWAIYLLLVLYSMFYNFLNTSKPANNPQITNGAAQKYSKKEY